MVQIDTRAEQHLSIMRRAWRSLEGRHVAGTAALCFAWSCCETARNAYGLLQQGNYTPAVNAVLSMQFNGLAVLLAVSIANQLTSVVRGAWWPYVPAVACGVLLGTTVMWIVSQQLLNLTTAYEPDGVAEPYRTFAFRHAVHALLICGLGTFAYVVRRRAARRLAALSSAQLERANAERQLQLSRLVALNARVDTQAIMEDLARIERSYECDRVLGDLELQRLVGELRGAIANDPDRCRSIGESGARLGSAEVQAGDRVASGPILWVGG